ncbi:MAG: tetratricopeptide repeat protein [Planctomycetota bacterium]|jgi:tetratricopeptide (TPR) repeat protein
MKYIALLTAFIFFILPICASCSDYSPEFEYYEDLEDEVAESDEWLDRVAAREKEYWNSLKVTQPAGGKTQKVEGRADDGFHAAEKSEDEKRRERLILESSTALSFGNTSRAIELLDSAAEIRDGEDIREIKGRTWYLSARDAILRCSYESARGYYLKSLELEYRTMECCLALIEIEMDLNNSAGVEQHIRTGAGIYTDCCSILMKLGRLCNDASLLDLAIEMLEKALATGENHYDIKCNIASIHWQKGTLGNAISWFESALEDKPDDNYALDNIIELAIYLENTSVIEKYIELQDRSAGTPSGRNLTGKAWKFLADTSFQKGRIVDAAKYMNKAVKHFPDSKKMKQEAEFISCASEHAGNNSEYLPRMWDDAWNYNLDEYSITSNIPPPIVRAAWPRFRKELEKICKFYGKTSKSLKLGGEVFLFNSESEYKDWCNGNSPDLTWAGGFYSPARNRIVTYRHPEIVPDRLVEVLVHEAAHQVIHTVWKKNVPVWFNEGLAQYFEARIDIGIKEKSSGERYRNLRTISAIRAGKEPFPLEQVLKATHEEFYEEGTRIKYYALAWSFLEFLFDAKKLPRNRAGILRLLKQAKKKNYFKRYLKYENKWLEWEKKQLRDAGFTTEH